MKLVPLKFHFHERKTAQAAAHLLKLNGGAMNYMVLIKLLFLADRTALLHHGQPITGASMVSMDKGPVLSEVLDLINEEPKKATGSPWVVHISAPAGYTVRLKAPAESDELSRYELRVLGQVFEEFGQMDKWELVHWLHENIPEWEDPHGSMRPISFDDVLKRNNVPKEKIESFYEDARVLWALRSLPQ